jgi:hypothetical protein
VQRAGSVEDLPVQCESWGCLPRQEERAKLAAVGKEYLHAFLAEGRVRYGERIACAKAERRRLQHVAFLHAGFHQRGELRPSFVYLGDGMVATVE